MLSKFPAYAVSIESNTYISKKKKKKKKRCREIEYWSVRGSLGKLLSGQQSNQPTIAAITSTGEQYE
jgi:hypothetical protein